MSYAIELARSVRDINTNDAMRSYADLQKLNCDESYPGFSRAGLKALDYFFFHHRIKAKTKNTSFYDAMHDEEMVKHLDMLVVRYKKATVDDVAAMEMSALQRHRYSVFQLYYGSVNQFRPAVAKWLYCLLNARVGILDFSAGWGGRCLAAMSLGIPYIGIDTNTNLKGAYAQMIRAYEPTCRASLLFKSAEDVDFSQFKYDLCFTSPPYFKLEQYEHMPHYPTKESFLEVFFRPVVFKAWKYLRCGGHLALNMPHEMYLAIQDMLPPIVHVLRFPIANKHPRAASHGTPIPPKVKNDRSEAIYVWRKAPRTASKSPSSSPRARHVTRAL